MKKEINILSLLTPIEKIPTIPYNSTLRQGLQKMRVYHYSAIPVIHDDGTYAGTVTEGDFLWFTIDHSDIKNIADCERYRVGEIIKPSHYVPMHINVGFDVLKDTLRNQNYVPLVDDRSYLIGIVSRADIVKALDV